MRSWIPFIVLCCFASFLGSCETGSTASSRARTEAWDRELGPVGGSVTALQLLRETRLEQNFLPPGNVARPRLRPMTMRYVTIHSTQNTDSGAGAHRHGLAMSRGSLRGGRIGCLCWHFTAEASFVVQHLPTTEQGDHADFDGPGNLYSAGIEMCEHPGNNRAKTIDITAKLAAFLCYANGLRPSSAVVPHYHWPREGYNPPNKNCPWFLLDNGKPGPTWKWFMARVQAHYNRISSGPAPRI